MDAPVPELISDLGKVVLALVIQACPERDCVGIEIGCQLSRENVSDVGRHATD